MGDKERRKSVPNKEKDKSGFLKLPKAMTKYIRASKDEVKEDSKISNVLNVKKDISFKMKDGKIVMDNMDMKDIPPQYQKFYESLQQQLLLPKFIAPQEEEEEEVIKRKGPRVEKGLKVEEILEQMRSLVIEENPWSIYKKVRPAAAFSILLDIIIDIVSMSVICLSVPLKSILFPSPESVDVCAEDCNNCCGSINCCRKLAKMIKVAKSLIYKVNGFVMNLHHLVFSHKLSFSQCLILDINVP